jgi:hypothetical protein
VTRLRTDGKQFKINVQILLFFAYKREKPMKHKIRISLLILDCFLALTALSGGIGLIFGSNAPPIYFLKNSLFNSYLIPGLALFVLVGGFSAYAFFTLKHRNSHAVFINFCAAASIIIFETVEVSSIGSPAAIARTLQIFYFAIGAAIGLLTFFYKKHND